MYTLECTGLMSRCIRPLIGVSTSTCVKDMVGEDSALHTVSEVYLTAVLEAVGGITFLVSSGSG